MVDEKFIDGIGEISISGMVVRFDMLALDPSVKDKKGQPTPALRQRVVMPIDGFVRSIEKLSKALPQLEKLGILKRRGDGEVDTLAAALANTTSSVDTESKK